jgi:thiamine-phosphate pyrophosphorylase
MLRLLLVNWIRILSSGCSEQTGNESSMPPLVLPKLYVILDAGFLSAPATECAQQLATAGVRLLQYRHKSASARELLDTCRDLVSVLSSSGASLIADDRPDVAVLAGAAGVHVGQDDLEVEQARAIVGPETWVGVSTHNLEQFRRAAGTSADYIAVGPIFATSTKSNPDPVVGPQLIRQVRHLTDKPIVAIGGITVERAREVLSAGADSLAVIGDILRAREPGVRARQYLEILDAANQAAAV